MKCENLTIESFNASLKNENVMIFHSLRAANRENRPLLESLRCIIENQNTNKRSLSCSAINVNSECAKHYYDGLGVLVKINNINDLINIGESDLGTINSQTTGINISKNEFDNLIKNINAESYNELVVINYIIVGIFVKISDIELGYINDTHVTPPDIDYSSISNEELNKLNKEIERKSKVDMREITNLSNENNIKIFYLENKTLYCHTPATNDEFKPANLY